MQNPLSPDEEHTLLLQIRTTPDAFQALYRHYFPRVFAYTAYRVGSKQDAEDLTAAIFVKLIQAITHFEYRGAGSFATWLFRIARNEVQQHYRAQYRRATTPLDDLPDIESTDLPPDEVFNRKQQFLRLHEFILTLWRDWLTPAFVSRLGLSERQQTALPLLRQQRRITNIEYQRLSQA
nr:sigma-70 family RNA polymerase sigma factor [Anaerolineae bacterium]